MEIKKEEDLRRHERDQKKKEIGDNNSPWRSTQDRST